VSLHEVPSSKHGGLCGSYTSCVPRDTNVPAGTLAAAGRHPHLLHCVHCVVSACICVHAHDVQFIPCIVSNASTRANGRPALRASTLVEARVATCLSLCALCGCHSSELSASAAAQKAVPRVYRSTTLYLEVIARARTSCGPAPACRVRTAFQSTPVGYVLCQSAWLCSLELIIEDVRRCPHGRVTMHVQLCMWGGHPELDPQAQKLTLVEHWMSILPPRLHDRGQVWELWFNSMGRAVCLRGSKDRRAPAPT
jgi:hypothetical protein